ncbi:MAG: hypothetical protein GY745_20585 [Actinomycetia bacterium]|nr:hypothetical protein [Actinomycetes bacterium]MCP4087420.1 hypothetical protein [Actinomycetes bacterium]
MTAPLLTQDEIEELDASVVAALDARDNSGLNVIGYGELSIALGYPANDPRVVCKPTAPYTPAELDDYIRVMRQYLEALAVTGVDVVPTSLMSVERGGFLVGYQVQPRLDPDSLADKILAAAQPDAEHPFLVALADIVGSFSDRVSIDSQVSNWSWDGATATSIDVGTPFFWDEHGAPIYDVKPLFRAIPAPLRTFAMSDVGRLLERYKQPRNVAADVVAMLGRIGLDQWVQPALVAFNDGLQLDTPIAEAEAHAIMEADLKAMPRLKKLQRVERAWVTIVRRRRYNYFVQPTTY